MFFTFQFGFCWYIFTQSKWHNMNDEQTCVGDELVFVDCENTDSKATEKLDESPKYAYYIFFHLISFGCVWLVIHLVLICIRAYMKKHQESFRYAAPWATQTISKSRTHCWEQYRWNIIQQTFSNDFKMEIGKFFFPLDWLNFVCIYFKYHLNMCKTYLFRYSVYPFIESCEYWL